jgi:hypothetical protein
MGRMIIHWDAIDNKVIWDLVIKYGLGDLPEDGRIDVYYDKKSNELLVSTLIDGIYLSFDNPDRFVFIHSFDNLKRYWEKKKKEIMISKKMQKKIDKEWFAWYDFVLGIYLADWMKTKIPDFER